LEDHSPQTDEVNQNQLQSLDMAIRAISRSVRQMDLTSHNRIFVIVFLSDLADNYTQAKLFSALEN
jgi:hypothetical protein